MTRAAREPGLDPLVWAALVQYGKVVLDAVLAWMIAIDVLGLQPVARWRSGRTGDSRYGVRGSGARVSTL